MKIETQADGRSVGLDGDSDVTTRRQAGQPGAGPFVSTDIDCDDETWIESRFGAN